MAKAPKNIDALTHKKARRLNAPTAELQSLAEQQEELDPLPPQRFKRARPLPKGETRDRDPDLDPQIVWNGVKIRLTREQADHLAQTGEVEIGDAQLVWRGKDRQDWSDLVVNAPMLYVQEKVHPKAIIDDLKRQSGAAREAASDAPDLFADFNGLTDPEARTEFYQHSMHWQNRMILGDSLQVMASLAERETLRGKVQCIYFDPPYGIKFNSNWQVSTLSRDVKDGKAIDVTREPEQVKAFRDTWKDGIHSYLTYLRDRLTVARELLTESGSIFVQIGDENVHRVRAVMDEVFGEENAISEILAKKKGSQKGTFVDPVNDYVLWYGKNPRSSQKLKFRALFEPRPLDADTVDEFSRLEASDGTIYNLKDYNSPSGEKLDFRQYPGRILREFPGGRLLRPWPITNGGYRENQMAPVALEGRHFSPPNGRCWSHTSKPVESGLNGMQRVLAANRLLPSRTSLDFKRYLDDFPYKTISNWWDGFGGAANPTYVVQTNERLVQRCILMTTDPGDLVLDPTCGSGTTAYVAEQFGRRWITIDTSRVALALARTRLVSARFAYYLLADSPEGRTKEQEITGRVQHDGPTTGDLRQGFVYPRAAYITSGLIAKNADIDVIWDKWQRTLEPMREALNKQLGQAWKDWQIPPVAADSWPNEAIRLHADWWAARNRRQKDIDASILRAADVEYFYDRPYTDNSRVRVTGPFTVESLSPHRVVTARDDSLGDVLAAERGEFQRGPRNVPEADFGVMVLEHLRAVGVQQKDKADAIRFSSLEPWPGEWVAAEGRYTAEDGRERRAAIFIGPEFGTVTRADLTAAAREASEARFDVLIACAFSYDAHGTELSRLGPLAILKARMNPDLHMSDELKNTGKGNLFVVFGEPDIDLLHEKSGMLRVKVNGIDVFDPATGEIRSDDTAGIACWFIDTDYNEESFFVRHAYFLGANDPYQSLKTALKAEIDEDAWASLYSDTSRPFPRPSTGRIAVKVINHFGDEVLKVFGV